MTAAGCLRVLQAAMVAAFALWLGACANTQVRSAGQMPQAPLCQDTGESVSAVIIWGTQWRPDQKEPAAREAAARRGIETFFEQSRCFASVQVLKKRDDGDLTLDDLSALARKAQPPASRVLTVTVRELGPVLKVFDSLALLEGGTEVVFDLRSFDVASGRLTSDFEAHWQRGGPWVVKGVGSLDADMRAALAAALRPRVSS